MRIYQICSHQHLPYTPLSSPIWPAMGGKPSMISIVGMNASLTIFSQQLHLCQVGQYHHGRICSAQLDSKYTRVVVYTGVYKWQKRVYIPEKKYSAICMCKLKTAWSVSTSIRQWGKLFLQTYRSSDQKTI
jgi:hypothetical protein